MTIEEPVAKTLEACVDTIVSTGDKKSALELCKQIKRWIEEQ